MYLQMQRQIGSGQETFSFFRPFNKTNIVCVEVIAKARFGPFTGIMEPIKIKVIQV